MKTKIIPLVIALFAIMVNAKAENKITLGDVTGNAGTKVTLPVSITNEATLSGYQFHLSVPAGVTVDAVEATERANGVAPACNLSDGVYKFSALSTTGATILDTEGVVANITLSIAENAELGDHAITLTEAVLFNESSNRIEVDGTASTLTVEEALVIEDFQFYAKDIVVEKGTTETTMDICLKNSAELYLLGLDLVLPDGITVKESGRGAAKKPQVTKVGRLTTLSSPATISLADGIYKIKYDLSDYEDESIDVGNDAVFRVSLVIAETVSAGVYEIKLMNQSVTNLDDEEVNASDYTAKLTVKGSAPALQSYILTATGDYQTLSLPFNAIIPSGVTAYTASINGNGENYWVELHEVSQAVIPAKTGVVILAKEAGTCTFNESNEENIANLDENIMLPTNDGVTIGEDIVYVLAKTKKENENEWTTKFVQYHNGPIGSNKAYFKWDNPNAAPSYIRIGRGDITTGIDAAVDGDAEYYDLSGRRISKNSNGMFIRKTANGSSIIIKK